MRGERDVQPFVACMSSVIHVNGRSLQQAQHRALDSLAAAVPGSWTKGQLSCSKLTH